MEKYLRVPEGRFVGKPLKVAPFMREDFEAIYDNPHGTSRAIISRARKNSKTTEAAMIVLLHTCGPEAKPNSQLFSAAQSKEQAAVLFALAAKMVRMNTDLNSTCTIRDTNKHILCPELGTWYRALSAEASTAYGLSPALIIHDELGQVKGPKSELYEALETATAAQESPLSLVISTQAPTDGDLLSLLIDDAKTERDPTTVLRMNSASEDVETFSEDAIRMANPAFDLFMNQEAVLKQMSDAKAMSSRQPEFENLVLNRRVEMNSPFVSRFVWKSCGGEVAYSFEGREVFAGLDLAETQDLNALVMTARIDEIWHVKPVFWLPEHGLREKSDKDRVPYVDWHKLGFLETTPGKSVQYEYVAERLYDLHCLHPFRKIAFDAWNFKHLKPWLQRAGFRDEELEGDNAVFHEFRQGFQSMTPALRTLEVLLTNEHLAHGNHPVLSMCAVNATVETAAGSNRKLSKIKSHGRIDGMVALAMAVAVAGADMPDVAVAFDIMAMVG